MTPKEIAEKSWTLWSDFYKGGDKSSDEILSELIADIEALKTIPINRFLCALSDEKRCTKQCFTCSEYEARLKKYKQ